MPKLCHPSLPRSISGHRRCGESQADCRRRLNLWQALPSRAGSSTRGAHPPAACPWWSHREIMHALGLNELATNAANYGALSGPAGRVALTTRLDASELRSVLFDGPAVPRLTGAYRGSVGRVVAERRGRLLAPLPPESQLAAAVSWNGEGADAAVGTALSAVARPDDLEDLAHQTGGPPLPGSTARGPI
jgi:hypothetical protein